MHLSDTDIGVLLDRDGDPSLRGVLQAHLVTCPSCETHFTEFEAIERLIGDSLRATDTPAPRLTVLDIRAATSRARPAGRPISRATRIAAAVAILTATAALAAAAMRGPLAGLITRTLHATAPQPTQRSAPAATQARGVGIVADSAVEVDFRVAQDTGEIRLTVGSGPRLLIQASADGPGEVSGRPGGWRGPGRLTRNHPAGAPVDRGVDAGSLRRVYERSLGGCESAIAEGARPEAILLQLLFDEVGRRAAHLSHYVYEEAAALQ